MTSQQLLDTEDIVTELDTSHLVIEDDTPVDNFQLEEQQRLLVEPLYSSKILPSPFLAAANVGLFYKLKGDPIVPDVLLSLGVQRLKDFSQRQNRSYFVWEFGKDPEVCIEIVCDAPPDANRKRYSAGFPTSQINFHLSRLGRSCFIGLHSSHPKDCSIQQ